MSPVAFNDPTLSQYFSAEEIADMRIIADPKLWAEDRLGWSARGYQQEFMEKLLDWKQVVLRWGRRLGKSDSMCVAALYFADTQYNADEEKGSYRVMIVCPYENQVDAIFDRMKVIVENSPKLYDSVKFTHHKATFANGSVITGKTAGSKQNTGAASLRGQGPDILIMDEVDYLSDKDIMNLINYKNEAPDRIRIIAASTPTGDRRMFYRWCTQAEDLGWCHIHRNSLVSTEIHKINPDNKLGLTYLEELKMQLTQLEYLHEVMAEFGESQTSLFQKRFIDLAIQKGMQLKVHQNDMTGEPPLKKGPRILGVDWDRAAASTNMIIIEFDRIQKCFVVLGRFEIPSHEFTYTVAVDKIIALNAWFDLDFAYVDKGYGETQIELLRKYGMMNPTSGLLQKVIGIQFSQKIEIRDPHTKMKVKKDVKPFMVYNAVNVFEKGMIALDPKDHKVIKQLEDYEIKKLTQNGRPTFVEQNEHTVDCIGLALLGFEQQYGELFNIALSTKIIAIEKPIDSEEIHSADAEQKQRVINLFGTRVRGPERPIYNKPIMKMPAHSRRSF